MNKKIACFLLSIMGCISITNASDLTPQMNLQTLKDQIIKYHKSGDYERDIDMVAVKAKTYLANSVTKNNTLKNPKKLALVLDIDETSLSGYADEKKLNFGGTAKLYGLSELKADAPAIRETRDLYRYAIKNNVTVFFITGREEKYRAATIKNLVKIGYGEVMNSTDKCELLPVSKSCLLYLRNQKYLNSTTTIYKTAMRKKIENAGYIIAVNLGDQYSDIAGGYSLRTYKYPNYMYYLP